MARRLEHTDWKVELDPKVRHHRPNADGVMEETDQPTELQRALEMAIPHPLEWAEESYVVQHVGNAGQWFDFSKCSVDPRPLLDDPNHSEAFRDHLRGMMPTDKPWRLIKRLAHETLLDGHDHV